MRQTPNSNNNVTPQVLAAPVGIDGIVKDIQSAMANLTWIEKSFNRAVIMSNIDADQNEITFAKCFIDNSKDEINVIANDNWQAYSFMLSRETEDVVEWKDFEESEYERDLSLYVWVNLPAIDDATPGNQLFEELKQDVKVALRNINFTGVYGITLEGVEDDALTVFNEFTINVTEKQLLYYPYRAMRFDMTATYTDKIICS